MPMDGAIANLQATGSFELESCGLDGLREGLRLIGMGCRTRPDQQANQDCRGDELSEGHRLMLRG